MTLPQDLVEGVRDGRKVSRYADQAISHIVCLSGVTDYRQCMMGPKFSMWIHFPHLSKSRCRLSDIVDIGVKRLVLPYQREKEKERSAPHQA